MAIVLRHLFVLVALVIGLHSVETGAQFVVPVDSEVATAVAATDDVSGAHVDMGCHIAAHVPVMGTASTLSHEPVRAVRPLTDYVFSLRTFQALLPTPPPIA